MPVYGLAEQAANIIRAKYNGVALPAASSVTPPSATTTGVRPTTSTTGTQGNGASWAHPSVLAVSSLALLSFALGL